MYYYEVLIADSQYRSSAALIYSFKEPLQLLSIVTVPLRQKFVTGFVVAEVNKPSFVVKSVKALVSQQPLPSHSLPAAQWVADYYCSTLSEALRQFAPSRPAVRKLSEVPMPVAELEELQLELDSPLTADQQRALRSIRQNPSTTVLLHGDTGTGKTRVYMELAKEVLDKGRSVILLTPEISLTAQLLSIVKQALDCPVYIFHSQLTAAQRKRVWLKILESSEPITVVGPRSALFAPIANPGLIVVDEAHEPSYKQDQSPRYNAVRVASQVGGLTGAKVILGTATPTVADYFLADDKKAVVRMTQLATGQSSEVLTQVVDMKDRQNFTKNPHLSNQFIDAMNTTLSANKQIIVYLNRRGSARLILCNVCGWQSLCPNCDIPLVYHGDEHITRCHTCGIARPVPAACPACRNNDIIYKTIGTKALEDSLKRFFPSARINRFDSDNASGERLQELYEKVRNGEIDILVGTQLLAKGLDLPRLGLVGVVAAETSLALPDYTAEERAFQLLYQVVGRVGRGHGGAQVVIQSYTPDSTVVQAAAARDWQAFYRYSLTGRRKFRFPPFSYLLQLVCKRATVKGAKTASQRLKEQLLHPGLAVEIIGPTPCFYARRGKFFYYQLVIKSKERNNLVELAKRVPGDWRVNLDPADLL